MRSAAGWGGCAARDHEAQTCQDHRDRSLDEALPTARGGEVQESPAQIDAPPRCRVSRADLLDWLRDDAAAVRLDLPDFVQFMLGTGLRIGEAAAICESVLDLDAATVHVTAIVVRVDGVGLHIQPRTKTPGRSGSWPCPDRWST
ncbi:MAG TPA: hypothetical protein VFI46_02415 [Jiangellaceae bacterium]|nr:hypothetical protein [Jiangellaceae bacterium]